MTELGMGAEVPAFLHGSGGRLAELIAVLDWASTPLGPIGGWSAALRGAVGLMVNSQFPMFMGWGAELTMLYNDAYIPVLGAKHPAALGQPCERVWSEIWDVLGPLAAQVQAGQANYQEDLLLVMRRRGFVEETYFTFSYSPIPATNTGTNTATTTSGTGAVSDVPSGGDGGALGLFCACTETTGRVIGERRLRALRDLGEASTSTCDTVAGACELALDALSGHRADLPFAAIYLLCEDASSARLSAAFGLNPAVAPQELAQHGEGGRILQIAGAGTPRVVTGLRERVGSAMFTEQTNPVGRDDPDTAVALPLSVTGDAHPAGVVVLGVSPYLALDQEYRSFCDLIGRQISTAIADARAYADQLRRAEELAELDRAKTAFFTGVSHELRTPLTLITGPAQDALDDATDPLPARQRERLELIGRNSARLRRLIDTLLEFSRIEAGQLRPEPAATELGGLTRGIAESFAPAVTRAGLELVIDCPPQPTAMLVDHSMWEKIVLNLLSNAVKYTLDGTITIALHRSGDGGARLTVSDTGIGIPTDDVGRVFDRFHRVRRDTSVEGGGAGLGRGIEGTGIGLALVAELAALHGGTVTATSTVGVGSEFTVTLPATARTDQPVRATPENPSVAVFLDEALQWSVHPPGVAAAGEPGTEGEQVPGAKTGPTAHPAVGDVGVGAGVTVGGAVLVVEDNPDLRAFIAGLLGPYYRVWVAGDGNTGLDIARGERVDLVLTDVMMPGLNGFELLAALRADPATTGIPVILLSARAGQEAVTHGLAAGADDYLVKPFSSTDLLARVRSNMELARLRNHESARRAAMVNSMQDGFYLQDLDAGGAIIEVNPAMTELLGLRPRDLPGGYPFPFWPTQREDPETHTALRRRYTAAANPGTGRGVVALRHVSTRAVVWVSLSYTSFTDLDGRRRLVVGTLRDVTAEHLAADRDAMLAETRRVLAQPGELIGRCHRVVELAVSVAGHVGFVALRGSDGRHRVVAAAHHRDPHVAQHFLALPPWQVPEELAEHYRGGRGRVTDHFDQAWARSVAGLDTEPFQMIRRYLDSAMVAPLAVAGRALGLVGFTTADPTARFTDADLGFAEELAGQVAAMIDTDQTATREHHLHQASTALAAAATVRETADALALAVGEALDASGVSVFIAHPDDPTHLHLEHDHGLGTHFARQFPTIPLGGEFLSCQVARTGEPVWLAGHNTYQQRHPHLGQLEHIREAGAVAGLPLRLGERTLGALALTFATAREFPPQERRFAMTLVGQAAQAIERATLADAHTRIAATLQTSLLPATLPVVACLSVATHYQPAGWLSQAGGDWYDVITLDDHRVAIVVGDVVGNGTAAAAIMGQLRAALATHLIDDESPGAAIAKLNHFAHRIDRALGSTVICLQLHTHTGELRWASAGHPPPLLITPEGTRYLSGGTGIVLGVNPTATYPEGHTTLAPGSSILLYTDGLVERRREPIDNGFDRLLAATQGRHNATAHTLLHAALTGCLPPGGTTDDVALIVARLLPPPLRLHLPAHPDQHRPQRRAIRAWATHNALPNDTTGDLILAVSEAAENCIEHAYPAHAPGHVHVQLHRQAQDSIDVQVTDDGHWRTPPTDPGHRGRGIDVIRALSEELTINPGPEGTTVTFTLAPDPNRSTPETPPVPTPP